MLVLKMHKFGERYQYLRKIVAHVAIMVYSKGRFLVRRVPEVMVPGASIRHPSEREVSWGKRVVGCIPCHCNAAIVALDVAVRSDLHVAGDQFHREQTVTDVLESVARVAAGVVYFHATLVEVLYTPSVAVSGGIRVRIWLPKDGGVRAWPPEPRTLGLVVPKYQVNTTP